MASTKSSKHDDNCNVIQLGKKMINEQHQAFLSSDVKSKCAKIVLWDVLFHKNINLPNFKTPYVHACYKLSIKLYLILTKINSR